MKQIVLVILLVLLSVFAYAQGTIFAWGVNGANQCNSPAGENYKMVSAGAEFVVALKTDGSLIAWGNNGSGQCNVPSGNDFVAVSAGFAHVIALKSNGTIVAWGQNDQGQTNVPSGSNFTKIDAGTYHNVALRSDGSLVGWGRNSEGQNNVPTGTFTQVAAGEVFSAAIRSNGTIVAWGAGWNGETTVPTGNDFVKISAQYHHGLALRSNGVLVAWGVNWNNQSNIPAGYLFKDMSAGWFHSIAVTTDGKLLGWGLDGNHQATAPAGAAGNQFGMVTTGMQFSVALTENTDADNDGVADDLDDYPNDAARAFNNFYPGENQWGTLAFEDMWPQQGDYDFNDLVIDYNALQVYNGSNKIKDFVVNAKLRAVGATRQNAFALELPFPASAIESVTSTVDGNAYTMPVTEAGDNSILMVIPNTNDFVTVPGNGVFWNTQPDQPTFTPVVFYFKITLRNAIDSNSLPEWGWANPFLIVNKVTGHEVHLAGRPPTIFANPSLFGTEDDTSNLTTGRYYKTIDNLPWALDIPVSWKYPIEKAQITKAYLAFRPWAESNGATHQNWYEMIQSQIESSKIYNR